MLNANIWNKAYQKVGPCTGSRCCCSGCQSATDIFKLDSQAHSQRKWKFCRILPQTWASNFHLTTLQNESHTRTGGPLAGIRPGPLHRRHFIGCKHFVSSSVFFWQHCLDVYQQVFAHWASVWDKLVPVIKEEEANTATALCESCENRVWSGQLWQINSPQIFNEN